MADLRWLCVTRPLPMASPTLARIGNSSHPYNPIPTRQGLRRQVAAVAFRGFSSRRKLRSFRCFSAALTPELKSSLDKVVSSHKVLVFIKGTKEFPQCGFSNTVLQILKSLNVPFETINILENELLRQGLKEYSSWPTFPQLYIDGEFFGGCDITVDAYKTGKLQEVVERALCS